MSSMHNKVAVAQKLKLLCYIYRYLAVPLCAPSKLGSRPQECCVFVCMYVNILLRHTAESPWTFFDLNSSLSCEV